MASLWQVCNKAILFIADKKTSLLAQVKKIKQAWLIHTCLTLFM